MRKTNTKRSFFADSFIYIFGSSISLIVPLLTLPITTRFLTPSDYGVVAIFIMFGQVSSSLLSLSLNSATYRFYFEYQAKGDSKGFRILNTSNLYFITIVFIFSGLLCFFKADWIADFFFNQEISSILIPLAFINGCLDFMANYFFLMLQARKKAISFSLISSVRVLLMAGLSIYLVTIESLTYHAIIYATLSSSVFAFVCVFIINLELIDIHFSFYSLKKSIKFVLPESFLTVLSTLKSSLDKTMLINYEGTLPVGHYSFGQKFGNIIKIIMDSIGRVWGPYFFENAEINTIETRKALVARYLELTAIYLFMGLCVIAFCEEVITVLLTEAFYPAIYLTPVFVYYYLIGDILGMLSVNQIMYAKRMHYMIPSNLIGFFGNILLNIILIPFWGVFGAVVATTTTALLQGLVLFYLGQKAYPLTGVGKRLFYIFIILIIFTSVLYLLMLSEVQIAIKVSIKFVILSLFLLICVKLSYIPKENLVRVVNICRNKILFKN